MADTALLIARMEVSLRGMEKQMARAGQLADKGVRDIENKFSKANLKLPETFGKNIGVALAGIASAQTLRVIRDAVGAVADLADQAERIGVSATSLQEFQYAVQLAGGSVEDANGGLEKFSKNLSEARGGANELGKIFQANSIAITDNEGRLRSVSDMLSITANLIKGASSEQDRLNIAAAAFGKGAGPALVLALADGAAGLKEAAAEAHNLGAIISEELVADAREFDDMFTRLEITASAWLKSMALMATKFAIPALQQVWGVMRDIAAIAGLGTRTEADVQRQIANLQDTSGAESLGGNLADAVRNQRAALEAELAEMVRVREEGEAAGPLQVTIRPQAGPTRLPPPTGGGGGRGRRRAASTRDKPGDTIRDLQLELAAVTAVGAEKDKIAITEETINQLRRAGVTATSAEGEQIAELVRQIKEAEAAQKAFNEMIQNVSDVADSGLGSFISGLREGKGAVESLNDALDSMLDSLLRIAQQQLIMGLFGGGQGGGTGLIGSLLGGMRGFQHGGITRGPSIAGEAGPEAVVPLPDGRRIPVALQGGGGGGVQVVVNEAPGSRVASRREEGGPNMKRIVLDIVNDHIASGGADGAMQGRYGARPRKVR